MDQLMNFEGMESALDRAAGYGKDVEFEALQDLAIAWLLRCHVVGNTSDLGRFYLWYIIRLTILQEKIYKEIKRLNEHGLPYQLRKRDMVWKMNATLAKIRAVLDSLPEVERG